ncbi:septum site-determining protein MinD [Clostridium baratii]|uniref:Septum site-determining protein MinD n=1 Tax=Clostridium baratii str. Sullivan TaxID=1415775 RepID=A0A0A7FTI6_9CLOT|nr:septum site-determining protein MinD [Clostridium baratii]AIY82917.1 septum site-determining protein MinD [Clostridium baratii str. Sullivan]AQM59980.1 septum site-determining protein MinD [Clostridium baratii]KJU73215.1 cell division inhibitor MinD [Clostridium baratii]MBS6005463.1 septum site-determining protein MinD [Clostridium baratii]MBS6042085.1 septum site-determining protein MinD [Clostridium baratii]
MGVSIVITSGKGGVGKTTTTANIGTALAALGKKVVVVDGDTGLRNLDVLMGLENRIVYTIIDAIEGRCRLKQALIKDKRFPNLCLLPTAQTKDKDDISAQDMLKLVKELKEQFDYVLIDSPAGIEQGFENSVIGADKAIVVVNPEITSVRDADRVIGKLDAKGLEDHSVIVNRLNHEMTQRGDMLDVSDIIETLSIELLGVVPDDREITVSTNKGEPIVLEESAKSGKAFRNIAKRITGEKVPIMDLSEEPQGLFGSIMKLFKRK